MSYSLGTEWILAIIASGTVTMMVVFGFWILRMDYSGSRRRSLVEEDEETAKKREEKARSLLQRYLDPCTKTLDESSETDQNSQGQDQDQADIEKPEVVDEELGEEPNSGCTTTTVQLPSSDDDSLSVRKVPNQCSICLAPYQSGQDAITWSSNAECSHVFHHDCIFNWLLKSAQQVSYKNRLEVDEDLFTEPAMSCPCCRQVFIKSTPKDCPKDEADGKSIKSDGSCSRTLSAEATEHSESQESPMNSSSWSIDV